MTLTGHQINYISKIRPYKGRYGYDSLSRQNKDKYKNSRRYEKKSNKKKLEHGKLKNEQQDTVHRKQYSKFMKSISTIETKHKGRMEVKV